MPSPTTVLQLIEDGLGLTNAVGQDQTLTSAEAALGLRVFNDLIEDWSTQSLAVYGQANQTFHTVAGQAVYTIGTGGDWNTTRPERIMDPAYSVVQGVSFPCVSINQAEYNRIPVKTQPAQFPSFYLYVNEFPLGLITLWPVPDAITPITFSIDRVLTAAATVGTTVTFPPGYAKAFKYALGVELAPWFGKSITKYPDVLKIAAETFGNIKRANMTPGVLMVDPAYSTGARQYYDWRYF